MRSIPNASNSEIQSLAFPNVPSNGGGEQPLTGAYAMVFGSSDFETRQCKVTSVRSIPGIGAQEIVTTLAASPLPSGKVFDRKQRFTIFNAPEFLTKDNTMVLQVAGEVKRLYFLPPAIAPITDPESFDFAGRLEVAMPSKTAQSSNQNWDCVICIDQSGLNGSTRKMVMIKDIEFSTGRATAIRVLGPSKVFGSIENCKFENFGHSPVVIEKGQALEVKNSTFNKCLRGFVTIDQGTNLIKIEPLTQKALGYRDALDGLTPESLSIKGCSFSNSGLLFPDSIAVHLTGYNIGTTVSNCSFNNISGMAVRFEGSMNTIFGNTFSNCVTDVFDWGAVYGGRSWVEVGNKIASNTFTNILWRGRPETLTAQTQKVPGSFEGDISAVYLDDYMCGTRVESNIFSNCQTAIISNGGRFNIFSHNQFGAPIYAHVLRTTCPRETFANIRFHDPANPSNSSSWNQAYYKFRNLWNSVYDPWNGGSFFTRNEWKTALEQGAFAWQPFVSGVQNDLEHLVLKLRQYANGTNSWANYAEIWPVVNSENLDWFAIATSTSVPNVPLRPYSADYSDSGVSSTRLQNAGNLWVWNVDEFAQGVRNPVTDAIDPALPNEDDNMPNGYNPATKKGYFHQRKGNLGLQDPIGYYSVFDPDTSGQ